MMIYNFEFSLLSYFIRSSTDADGSETPYFHACYFFLKVTLLSSIGNYSVEFETGVNNTVYVI